ncbi:MAG: DUF2865 domain-containing protein [Pseudomonadota bacterium]
MTVFSPRACGVALWRGLEAAPPLVAILVVGLGIAPGEAATHAAADFEPIPLISAPVALPAGSAPATRGPRVRVAQANNPLAAFFSIFQQKPKSKPVRQRPVQQRGPVIQQLPGGGRRIFNPFFNHGRRAQSELPQARPKHMGRRTMCVRMCDGYYWPMRRGGSNASLMSDSQKCESQCSSPAKLFILRSSTDNIGEMRSLDGQRYRQLKNAFVYRKTFNPSCGCRAKPWSERAQLRHKQYAAVGKERARIALRKVRLDLRSTLKPEKVSLAIDAAQASTDGIKRFWDPTLPVRKPRLRALQSSPVARSRTLARVTSSASASLESRPVATSLAAKKVSTLRHWLRADVFGGRTENAPTQNRSRGISPTASSSLVPPPSPDVRSSLKLRSSVQ